MIRSGLLSRRHTIIAVSIIVIALVMGLGLLVTKHLNFSRSGAPHPSITPGHLTLSGSIVCLPHKKSDGPQTLECAFGLQSDAGAYYGLRQLEQDQLINGTLTVGTRVRVSGEAAAPDASEKYAIVGTITVESIEVISSAVNRFESPGYDITLRFNNGLQWSYL